MTTISSRPYEAGIVLTGTEIKSIRAHRLDLKDAYAAVEGTQVWLHNMHISPYEPGSRDNPATRRSRKLLLHRREIYKLLGRTVEKGLTIIPLKVYLERGYAKIEIGLARGRRNTTSGRRSRSGKRAASRTVPSPIGSGGGSSNSGTATEIPTTPCCIATRPLVFR